MATKKYLKYTKWSQKQIIYLKKFKQQLYSWQQISNLINKQFPRIKRSPQQCKYIYENNLRNGTHKQTARNLPEQGAHQIFIKIKQHGLSWKKIKTTLSDHQYLSYLETNSLKNYYYTSLKAYLVSINNLLEQQLLIQIMQIHIKQFKNIKMIFFESIFLQLHILRQQHKQSETHKIFYKDFTRFISLVLQDNNSVKINQFYDMSAEIIRQSLTRNFNIDIHQALNIYTIIKEFWSHNQPLKQKILVRKSQETLQRMKKLKFKYQNQQLLQQLSPQVQTLNQALKNQIWHMQNQQIEGEQLYINELIFLKNQIANFFLPQGNVLQDLNHLQ